MESSEHIEVGRAITLDDGTGTRLPAAETPLPAGNFSLTYGHIVALGGDFYGTPDLTPISSSNDPLKAAESAWATLASSTADEREKILGIIREEQLAIANARRYGQQPSAAFEELGDSLSFRYDAATGGPAADAGRVAHLFSPGRYLRLTYVNMDHFGQGAVLAYRAGHIVAMTYAAGLHGRNTADPNTRAQLLKCYAFNAFADHFLSDLFAAGHVRTPRRALYEMSASPREESGFLARVMHNEDNHDGLSVANARGERWVAYGDGKELDDVNAENFRRAIAAVQCSADEVTHAFATGQVAARPAALDLIPNLAEFEPNPVSGGPNHAPLFWTDAELCVYRRGGVLGEWEDKNSYDFTHIWSSKTMVLLEAIKNLLPTT